MLDRFGVEEYKSIGVVYSDLPKESRMPAFVCQFVQLWKDQVDAYVLMDLFSDLVFALDERTGLNDQHLLVIAADILTQKFGEDEEPEVEMRKVLNSIASQYDAIEALNLEDSELEEAIQHVKDGKPYIEEGPEEDESAEVQPVFELMQNSELAASSDLPLNLFVRKASKLACQLGTTMPDVQHLFTFFMDRSRLDELAKYLLGQMLFMDQRDIRLLCNSEDDFERNYDINEILPIRDFSPSSIIEHLGEESTIVRVYKLLSNPVIDTVNDYSVLDEILDNDYTPLIDTGLVSYADINAYGVYTPELVAARAGLKSTLSLDPELMLSSMSLYWLDPTSDKKFLSEVHPDLTHLREDSALSKVYMETLTLFVESGMATPSQMFYYMIIYTYHRLMHELPVSATINPKMKVAIEIARHLFKPRKSTKLPKLFKDIELDLSGFQLHSDLGLDCTFDAELKEFTFTREGKTEVVQLKSVIYLPAQLINKTTELYGKLETMFLIADYFQD